MADPQGALEREDLRRRVRQVDENSFEEVALRLFRYQAARNPVFRRWLDLLGRPAASVRTLNDLPFLPIRYFKQYDLKTGCWSPETSFLSSGTTGSRPSRHQVHDLAWYLETCERGFRSAYGPAEEYVWLALLPAYLERPGSSLIAMADHFIRRSAYRASGFYLDNHRELVRALDHCRAAGLPVVLLGVSFALLDLCETLGPRLDPSVIVMETGGMKGRRKEITREALHQRLRRAFGVPEVHSEYGMTELFSQAYSQGEGLFAPAPTMRVFIREVTDPLSRPAAGRAGALDIVDLANVDSVAFIATEDLGRTRENGTFEVLGRLDASDVRGCNLLVA